MKEQKALTPEMVKEKALRYLEFRNHSEHELRQKLKRAGAGENDIEPVIEFCCEYGFLNDCKYAVALAKDLSNLKKYGKQRIRNELLHRGIKEDIADEALSEIEDNIDELEVIINKKLKGDYSKKNCDKVIRYCIYRGYEFGSIKNVIERLTTDEF